MASNSKEVWSALTNADFFTQSFKLYGGVNGLYDYLPAAAALRSNVLAFWRKHFAMEEQMFELDCPCLTPEVVLEASGHVEKFTDLMVKDEKTGTYYRADHLLKDFCKDKLDKDLKMSPEMTSDLRHLLDILDNLSAQELGAKIKQYAITAPDSKNPVSDVCDFNLMFKTSIGPSGLKYGYLRPETAQGMLLNFQTLYNKSNRTLPFACFQIGKAFRNEISPRQKLLRSREFTLAEIEHFVDPNDKSHRRFSEVSSLEFLMLPREDQMLGHSAKTIRLSEAVAKGVANSETLGYFMGRVYLFLTRLGIDKKRLRFRQHLANEMAHYAADCWDAEIHCSYGWIECVGIADRGSYDLRAHSEKSGTKLEASVRLPQPREEEKLVITTVDKELGPIFKADKQIIIEALKAMDETEAAKMMSIFESEDSVDLYVRALERNVTIKKSMVKISKSVKKVHTRDFIPTVIEPAFGVDRIVYCLLEHSYYTRPSKDLGLELTVFRFSPLVAPVKCAIFSLVQSELYEKVALQISKSLTMANISNNKDIRGSSIGRKYVKADEEGVPFAITVDSESTVTIRERDSKDQVRLSVEDVVSVVKKLIKEKLTWADVWSTFLHHSSFS